MVSQAGQRLGTIGGAISDDEIDVLNATITGMAQSTIYAIAGAPLVLKHYELTLKCVRNAYTAL